MTDEPAAALRDYRLAPALAARLLGVSLVVIAVLVLLATLLVGLLDLSVMVVVAAALVALLLVGAVGAAVTRAAYVVRLTPEGYRVRFVRGVGVASGRWEDVADAVTARVGGSDCLVLRLRTVGRRPCPSPRSRATAMPSSATCSSGCAAGGAGAEADWSAGPRSL